MTDETPPPEPRRLTRSGSDAIIGGVASGLGRHFDVDPLLFRIGFVVLSFAGGFGVLAYLLLLAFVPADGTTRPGGTSKAAALAGAVVLGVALVAFLGTPFFFFGPGLLILAVVGLAAVLLWRAFGGQAGDDPARTAGRLFLVVLLGIAVAGAALGVGLAAALGGGVVIASLAVVDRARPDRHRLRGRHALADRARPGARAAARHRGGGRHRPRRRRGRPRVPSRDGERAARPLRDRDRRPRRRPDASSTSRPAGPTSTSTSASARPSCTCPADTCVTSDVEIGAGASDIFDRDNDGVDVSFAQAATPPAGRPVLHIEADVGVGVLEVVREGSLPDLGRHRQRFEIFDDGQDARYEGGTGCA